MEYVYPKKKQKTVLCASSAANVFGSVFTILTYSGKKKKNKKDIPCGSYLIHLCHLIPLFKPLKLINVHC